MFQTIRPRMSSCVRFRFGPSIPGKTSTIVSFIFGSWTYRSAGFPGTIASCLHDNAPATIEATTKLTRIPTLALSMDALLLLGGLLIWELYRRRDTWTGFPYPLMER